MPLSESDSMMKLRKILIGAALLVPPLVVGVALPAGASPPDPITGGSFCTSSGISEQLGDPGDQVIPSTGVLSQVSLNGTNGGLEINWTFSAGVPIPTSHLGYTLYVQIFQTKSAAGHSLDTSFDVTIGAGGVPGNRWTGTVAKFKTFSSSKSHSVVVGEVGSELLVFVPHSSLSGLRQPFYWDASELVSSIPSGGTDRAFCPNAQIKSNRLVVPVPYAKFPGPKSPPVPVTTPPPTTAPTPGPGGYTATQVCADIGQGQSGNQVVNDVESAAPVGSEPWGSAYQFVAASVASTCPQYQSVVGAIQHG